MLTKFRFPSSKVDVDGNASDSNNPVLVVLCQNYDNRHRANKLTKSLFWQQTGWEWHEFWPIPRMSIGEQVIPLWRSFNALFNKYSRRTYTRASTPCRTTPTRPRRIPTTDPSDCKFVSKKFKNSISQGHATNAFEGIATLQVAGATLASRQRSVRRLRLE